MGDIVCNLLVDVKIVFEKEYYKALKIEEHHFWGSGSKLDMKNSPIFRNFGSFFHFWQKDKVNVKHLYSK